MSDVDDEESHKALLSAVAQACEPLGEQGRENIVQAFEHLLDHVAEFKTRIAALEQKTAGMRHEGGITHLG